MLEGKDRETKTVVEAHLYEENDKLREVIKAAQEMLAKHMPSDGITGEEAISGLLGILDNQDLFELLNENTNKDSLNIELEKLELKDGDILIVKYSDAMSSVDLVDFTERLIKSPAAQGKKDIQIVLVAGDMDIKSVDEKAMSEAGWFKLPCEKENGVGGLAGSGLYKALDRLYERGWLDKHKEQDYDPRGTVEWGVVEIMFRKQKSI